MGITSKAVGKAVQVGADLWAPPRIRVDITDVEDLPVDVHAELRLDGARYVVAELAVRQREGGPPITGELIRTIPVQTLVRGGIADVATMGTRAFRTSVALGPEEHARLAGDGPTDETLRWVARIYVQAQLAGEPPTKAVKDTLRIPLSTAGYWIRRTKDKGFMDPVKQAPAMTIDETRRWLDWDKDGNK